MAPAEKESREATRTTPGFLEVRGLEKTFERRSRARVDTLHVLNDVTLTAHRGEFVTVIGESGCGKTTLLNCIAGLASPDAGTISLDGVAVRGPGPDRAVVFQHASLLPWRTVQRNVAYGLGLRRELRRAEISARVDRVLQLVGLADFADHYPHEISGGMQQRVNLARALAVEPKLILMDEPFGALDALTKEALQDELVSLGARTALTALFITHDITEAVYLADRVIVMSPRPGRISASIEVPFERPRTRAVTESEKFSRLVSRLRGLVTGPSQPTHTTQEERS